MYIENDIDDLHNVWMGMEQVPGENRIIFHHRLSGKEGKKS